MLHILWLILKFILVTLGILLGLVLLVLLLVLFCPVRYRAQAVKTPESWKSVRGSAGVSWLFHLVSVQMNYQDGQTSFSARILGVPLNRFFKKKTEKEDLSFGESAEPAMQEKQEPAENSEEGLPEPEPEMAETDREEPFTPEDFFDSEELLETELKKRGLFRRFCEKLENIGLTFRSIHDKMDQWKAFLHHPRTQEAFSLVWKHGKFLVKHILPTKVEGDVTFSFENPASTGKILAVLGMSFPLHKNRIAVHPLFDGENVLEGDVKLKGRIYGIVLVRAAVIVIFNKNVKYVIRRVKRMRHKEG